MPPMWTCPACGKVNDMWREHCAVCRVPRPKDAQTNTEANLADSTTFNDLLTKVRFGETTVLDVTGTDAARKIVIEARKVHAEEARPPKRQESPPRNHTFLTAESFAAYLSRYGGDATVVFADPVAGVAHAVLDERAVGGFETVMLVPAIHPLWAPWAGLKNPIPLAAFANHVAQNRSAVVVPDGKELALLLSQVRAAVKTEVQHGRGKAAVNGVMITTTIQGVSKNETVELPDEIVLNVPLFVGGCPSRVEIDLCLDANRDGEVFVSLAMGAVVEAKVAAFEAMVNEVAKGLGGKGTLTFGRPAVGSWGYLKELA